MPNAHLLLLGNVFLSLSQVLDLLPSDSLHDGGIHSYSHLSSPNCISASLGDNPLSDISSIYFAARAPGTWLLAALSPPRTNTVLFSHPELRPDIPKKQLDPWFQASTRLQPYIQREEGTLPPSSSKDSGWPDLCHMSIPGPVLWFNRCSI